MVELEAMTVTTVLSKLVACGVGCQWSTAEMSQFGRG